MDLLLAAAAAPAAPAELAGERAAVAGFVQARGDQPRRAGAGRSVVRSRLRRALVVKVAVGLSVAIGGGTAFAAQTARLPAATQQRVHNALPFLAPPAPSRGTPAPAITPSNQAGTAGPALSIAPSAGAHVVELCRAWRDRQSGSPGSAALTSTELAVLAAAAGTRAGIPAFCDQVLADNPGRATPGSTPVVPTPTVPTPAVPTPAVPTPAVPTPAVPTPSHPGGSPHPHPIPKR